MGNEVDENDKRKILTNKSSFNQSNCREIQDSDSEIGSKEDFKKDLSKHIISDPKDPNKEEYEDDDDEMEMSNNNINNKNSSNNIDQNNVEYTFVWKEGGTSVKLVGSFNNWKEQIVMEKDPTDNIFKYKLRLKRDKYDYKFIVDNVWKYSRQQTMKTDERGNTNNFIDLTNYKISKNSIKSKVKKKKKKVKKIKKEENEEKKQKDDNFTVILPGKEELNSEAPTTQELYLNSFHINNPTNQKNVGEPQYYKYKNRESFTEEKSYKNLLYSPHVNLNHTLTLCEQKHILQVGLTYRFRNKDCTTIYYSRLES
jgi:hypothetical protein